MPEAAFANQMTSVHSERRHYWVHRFAINLRVNQPSPQLSLWSCRQLGCKIEELLHLTKHCHIDRSDDVYQVAKKPSSRPSPQQIGWPDSAGQQPHARRPLEACRQS